MKKLTITLVALVVVTGIIMVASLNYPVIRAREAIAAIPDKITYTDECNDAIDEAATYESEITDRLNVVGYLSDEEQSKLLDAKVDAVRLAIKAASNADSRKTVDNLTDDDVRALITTAREKADAYLSDDEKDLVENYSDLTDLEAAYADSGSSSSEASGSDVEVQLC